MCSIEAYIYFWRFWCCRRTLYCSKYFLSCFWGVQNHDFGPILVISDKSGIFWNQNGLQSNANKWPVTKMTKMTKMKSPIYLHYPVGHFCSKNIHFCPKMSKMTQILTFWGFSHFLTNLVIHFFGPQDVRKWHILGHFWTPFLTTSWQIPTQIGYPTGPFRSWPSKRGLILTPLFGLSRYCPIRGIYPHFLDHFWIKNGQKTGPKHLVFWGSRQKTLSRSQK